MTEEPPEFTCYSCMDYGTVDIYAQGTDAFIGSQPCPELGNPDRHPPCGQCESCRWTRENGALDELTGLPSYPICTGPPVSWSPPPLCTRQCATECAHNPYSGTDCPPF